ncbi:hypothetical protein DRO58_01570 [Candidatus Bathyarchaeota archaeon]|nr:MAG: hypothetical protein DRO58_01570 [Candidatus Bathyarchaeota archaeon]
MVGLRIGLFSDTHIGRCIPREVGELRRRAFRYAFSRAVDAFIRERVDYVIHAGDLFEKAYMTPGESVFVKNELHRLVEQLGLGEASIFVVRGNHDGTADRSALDYVRHPLAKYLRVIGDRMLRGEAEAFSDGELTVTGLGYHPFMRSKFKAVKPLVQKALSRGGFRVLVIHSFVEGLHPIPPGCPQHSTIPLQELRELPADMVVAGHYHGHVEPYREPLIVTPGGTEAINLTDKGPFGVYIVEDGRPRFLEVERLYEVGSLEVSSSGAVKPASWFLAEASKSLEAFKERLKASGRKGIARLAVRGVTSDDSYELERRLRRLAEAEAGDPILHVRLVCEVSEVGSGFTRPAILTREEVFRRVFQPLDQVMDRVLELIGDVDAELEEHASERTHILTDSRRRRFVESWVKLLEEVAR